MTQKKYTSLAVEEEVRWKFDQWVRHLTMERQERSTHTATLEYLLDTVGPPDGQWEGVGHTHTYRVDDNGRPVCVYCREELEL